MVVKTEDPVNEVTTEIQLIIEEEPYVEMMKYAHAFSPNECSGTGLVERIDYKDGSTEFVVKKVYLPNQTNTGGTTDIEDDEMARINTQVVVDGDDPALHKFHWHSHVDMGVFHSQTDKENYDDMQTGDYAVSLVVNKKYDMLASVHLYEPLRVNILNIEVEPPDVDFEEYEVPTALQTKLEKNIERVKQYEEENKKVVTTYTGYNHNWDRDEDEEFFRNRDAMNSYGWGLADDPDFLALLKAGEEQGMITLYEDTTTGHIIGYMNKRTKEYYELNSYLDYTTY